MNEQEKKYQEDGDERQQRIVFITVGVLIYIAGVLLLARPMNWYVPNRFFGPVGFAIVLGFDVLWGIGIVKKNKIVRFLSTVIFATSGAVLTCWLILILLGGIR